MIVAHRANHQWMAFIDVDEFLVIRDAAVASLPQLLLDYTDYGALTVNWQVTLCTSSELTCCHGRKTGSDIGCHHCVLQQASSPAAWEYMFAQRTLRYCGWVSLCCNQLQHTG